MNVNDPGGTVSVRPHTRQRPGAQYGGIMSLPMRQQLGMRGITPPGPAPGSHPMPMQTQGAYPGVVMQGNQPTLGAYHQRGALPPGSDPMVVQARRQQDVAYARTRLAQLQRVVSLLSPDLQQQLAAGQRNVDPAAAWRAISGAFANYSRQQGFNDPRYFLQNYLPQQLNAQGRSAAGGV